MRFKGELTPETLLDEYNRWWIDHGNVRDPHDQRFGQYIWNKYARRDVQTGFPELFYEENVKKAYDIALQAVLCD